MTTTQIISVQRALGELKILDDRIQRQAQQGRYTTYLKADRTVRGNKNKEDFGKEVKAQFQSVKDLIARRRAIKREIVQSNAITKITVAGKSMTVAEAIEMKDSIVLEKTFLNHLRYDFNRTQSTVDFERTKAEVELNKRVDAILGKDARQDANLAEQVAEITKQFDAQNKYDVYDPANVEAYIKEQEQMIEEFINDIDNLLLESNVKTSITVEA